LEVDLYSGMMTGTAREECVALAVAGQGSTQVGPETAPWGSPEEAWSEEAWSEGEACVRGLPAADGAWGAWEAWGRDVHLVMTGAAGLAAQEAEPA
jgi:hypothetical protein